MNKEIKIVYSIILTCGIISLAWGIIFWPNFIFYFSQVKEIYTTLGIYRHWGDVDYIHIKFIIGGIIGILVSLLIKGFAKK